MATSEILGLFTSPEQYQLAQQKEQQARAIQYANLDPMARANYGVYRAGQKLGGAISGALGGQDPQLKLISQRQQLASQLDPSDPQSYMKVAEIAAQSGDQQFAIVVADAGRKAMSDFALIQQRNRERQGADPFEQLIRSGKYTPASLATYKVSQNVGDLVLLEKEGAANKPFEFEAKEARLQKLKSDLRILQNQETPNTEAIQRLKDSIQAIEGVPKPLSTPSFGTEAERKSKAKYGKPYADLTPTEAGIVDKLVEESEKAKAKASAIMLPNQPVEPKDWIKFSDFINKDPLMNRTSTIISDAPTAIETIRNSTQNNFSAASLPAAIAKLTGEGKNMSNQDIERYTRVGGLDQRIAGDVVKFFTGKKTDATKAEAEQFAVALYRGALIERKKFIEDQAESTGYNESPNYKKTIEQLDKKLAQFKLVTPSSDADKEKRYQEFKAKELAKQSGATR